MTVVGPDGMPLGILKRGKPRIGDNVYINDEPYEVIERERDVVTVRQTPVFAVSSHENRRNARYQDNRPVSRMAGFVGRFQRNTDPPDIPKKKAPSYPQGFGVSMSTGASFDQQTPGLQIPYVGPQPVYEGVFPYQKPTTWRCYYYKFPLAVYDLETAVLPRVGQRDEFGEKYEFYKVFEDRKAILVKPLRHWNYVVITLEKASGDALIWIPMTNKNEMFHIKPRIKAYLKDKLGIDRGEYQMVTKPFSYMKRYATP